MPISSNVDDFKSNFSFGVYQSPNRYEIEITPPEGIETEGQPERKLFETWMDSIIPNKPYINSDYRGDYYKFAYQTSMIIKLLTKSDKEGSRYTLEEIYPSEILPTEYSSSRTNVLSELTIKFNYKSYFIE